MHPYPTRPGKNKGFKVGLIIVLVLVAGFSAYAVFAGQGMSLSGLSASNRKEDAPAPAPLASNLASSPASVFEEEAAEIAAESGEMATFHDEVMPDRPQALAAQGSDNYLNMPAGNAKIMTVLQAELEQVVLEKTVQEERNKLYQLKDANPSSPASISQVVLVPSPAVAPEIASSAPVAQEPEVLAIQGLDGKLSATVLTPAGLMRTVRVGDAFGSGKVERITSVGVHIRDGEQTRLLAVGE
jgi:type IV pilus biogenesis protein PilP